MEKVFWERDSNEYKVRLSNNKIVGVGDTVIVKFSNGRFKGVVKQTAGFGINEHREVISVVFPGKSNGKKVHIDDIIDKI